VRGVLLSTVTAPEVAKHSARSPVSAPVRFSRAIYTTHKETEGLKLCLLVHESIELALTQLFVINEEGTNRIDLEIVSENSRIHHDPIEERNSGFWAPSYLHKVGTSTWIKNDLAAEFLFESGELSFIDLEIPIALH
jgi:hypothetical protein